MGKEDSKDQHLDTDSRVHVLSEIAPLKKVLIWGEPGCEALLGQLLPKTKSLFFSYYQVAGARKEFEKMQELLEQNGAKVIRIKDAYARILRDIEIPEASKSTQELRRKLMQKADELYQSHSREKERELREEGSNLTLVQIYAEVRRGIPSIIQEDVEKYGEGVALKLNYVLSLSGEFPMANIVYARDQSNSIGDKIVLSVMRWGIRGPEVEIYQQALNYLGYGPSIVEIKEGTIEGGDTMIFGDECYIGVGARTSMEAVVDLYTKLGKSLEQKGIKIVAVVNGDHARVAPTLEDPTEEQMQVMHLDTFWTPIDPKTVLAYGEEVDKRKVVWITNRDGRITTIDLGSFTDYLTRKEIEIINVTAEEQAAYATNLLNLGNGLVVVPLSTNVRVTQELEQRGIKVLPAEIFNLVGGYGAVHCMTASLERG